MTGNLDKDDAALIRTLSSAANVMSVIGKSITSNEDMDNEVKASIKEFFHTSAKSLMVVGEVEEHKQNVFKELVYDIVSDPRRNTVINPESCPSQTILYKTLKSNPRGYCLIINNLKFKTHKYRGGSDVDVRSLTDLFENFLGFSATFYENLTEQDTYKKLEKFSMRKELSTVDALAVFLMSHGKVTEDNQLHILSSDEKLIKHDRIIHQFGNFKCPALEGCPKMFFYQVCRGVFPDFKTSVQLDNDVTQVEPPSNILPQMGCSSKDAGMDPTKEAEPRVTLENILRVFPSAPGYSSIRDPAKGSWMIQAICSTFRENARTCDVETMLKMVNKRIQKDLADSTISQVLCTESWGFDNKVFLNPPEESD